MTTASRLTLGLVLTLGLSACAGQRQAQVLEPGGPNVRDRFDADGLVGGDTTAVPRAPIGIADLEENAPNEYTVIEGDTLWSISDRFLKQPWRWPELWNYNPEIANPHLIYPGDVIALENVGGRPKMLLRRDGVLLRDGTAMRGTRGAFDANGEPSLGAATPSAQRLSPRIRSESLDDAIPTIPGDAIGQFLVHPRVVTLDAIENAPYVVGNIDDRLISALGHRIYVRGEFEPGIGNYGIYRKNKALKDPTTGELLGHEIVHVADAKLLETGDPATFGIVRNRIETTAGDILLPMEDGTALHTYKPRLPEISGEGRIVSLVDAITQTGRNQVVVLNLGERSGIAAGDMLAIESRGASLVDRRGGGSERIALPALRTGVVMVFRAFEKVSYALVMESTRPVTIEDSVTGI